MSEHKGDKARYFRAQQRKILRRKRVREILGTAQRKTAVTEAASDPTPNAAALAPQVP